MTRKAKSPTRKAGVKRYNSKESGASMMVVGASMREPSVNPDAGHPAPHAPLAGPAAEPPANLPREVLRHGSDSSQKDSKPGKGSKFVFASHPLQIDSDGSYVVDGGAVGVYASTFRTQVNKAPKDVRQQSNFQFTEKHVANAMIKWIQDKAVFEKLRRHDSRTQKRNLLDPGQHGPKREQLMQMINGIADLAEAIFEKEPRVLKVEQPVIVFGDVHGNLSDLMVYEHLFWKDYPTVLPWNYLFLGDYVDRSTYSLETILYLLSQKIVAKNKFFLIRGNHEFRNVNKVFSFYTELVANLGKVDGDTVWQRLNKVFDVMPMCAVIDQKIFCCHGGVPSSSKPGEVCDMKELESINCPFVGFAPDAPDVGGPAWELVWNDPLDKQEFADVVEHPQGSESAATTFKTGFAPNTKRHTGKYFSEQATRNFLTLNGFDYVLRAHECVPQGYQSKHGGHTTTVFSSSGYSAKNNAAVVFVHDGKIRPVRVKTKNDPHPRR